MKPRCGDGGVGAGAEGGEQRDDEEAEDELGEFLPEEGGFVVELLGGGAAGEAVAHPLDGVGEDDEADEGVAAGLGEDGVLAGGVGVEGSGGGGFGGVVDGEAGPEAVGVVGHVEGVADQREGKERERAEGEDRGDGGGGVFFVGVDGSLRGDDGGDSADARSRRRAAW